MKNPVVLQQGIKLKFFVVIPAKAGIQKKVKDWIPHPPIAVEGRQVRNDRNKVTLWQRPQGIAS